MAWEQYGLGKWIKARLVSTWKSPDWYSFQGHPGKAGQDISVGEVVDVADLGEGASGAGRNPGWRTGAS